MHFDKFLKYSTNVLNVELPEKKAHFKMVPYFREELLINTNLDLITPKKAAVMMLFYPKNSQTHLALILRTSYNGVHSSQIAFPGGKVELYDKDLTATALRETHEEIGIHPSKIKVIRQFSEVYIPPSNFIVYPFFGFSNNELDFTLQQEEVAGLVELPLSDFMNDKIIVNNIMKTSYANDVLVPGFKVNEYFIWGATAMMLSELKETLKLVL